MNTSEALKIHSRVKKSHPWLILSGSLVLITGGSIKSRDIGDLDYVLLESRRGEEGSPDLSEWTRLNPSKAGYEESDFKLYEKVFCIGDLKAKVNLFRGHLSSKHIGFDMELGEVVKTGKILAFKKSHNREKDRRDLCLI